MTTDSLQGIYKPQVIRGDLISTSLEVIMDRSWYLGVCLAFGSLLLLPHVSSEDSSFSVSYSSGEIMQPCIYRGIPYIHGESWKLEECVTCTCDNGTVTCIIESCQPVYCREPVKLQGECCFRCPYHVIVREINPSIQGRLSGSANGNGSLVLGVDVQFTITQDTTGVNGESIWDLDAWLVLTNGTERINFTEQVLTADQRSQSYTEGKPFNFLDVLYSYSAPSLNCEEANVCVELKRGRNAQPTHDLDFNLQGSNGSESLTGCTSLCSGRDATPCVDSNEIHWHQDVWQRDLCTECTCDNGTSVCSVEECPTPDCKRPVRLEGECCISCPYHVRVRRVSPLIVAHGVIGNQEDLVHLRVPITFKETQHTTNVEGKNLWKLSAWVALHLSNDGRRYAYREQILDKDQRSQTYVKGQELVFEGVEFRIVHPSDVVACDSPFFICVRFDMDPDYRTVHDHGFELSGFPNNSSLTGCKSATLPEKWCRNLDPSDGTSNSGNTESLMSCHLDGNDYAHDEEWKLSACTACECDNGTIRCHTEYCKPTHCEAPIKHPDECCFICPIEPSAKTDICVPLVISGIVLLSILLVVLILVVHRRKKSEKQKEIDGVILMEN